VLARAEPALVAAFLAHAVVAWVVTDTGVWSWSVSGILAMLAALVVAGAIGRREPQWLLLRGGLALSTLVLIGGIAPDVAGLETWYAALAFIYPLVLPARLARVVPLLVAGTYFGSARLALEPVPMDEAAVRTAIFLGVGVVAYAIGALIRRLRGEREHVEVRLRETKGVLQAAFDNASGGMALLDPEGGFVQVNQAMCDLLGKERPELLEGTWWEMVHAADVTEQREGVAKLFDHEVWSFQKQCRLLAAGHEPVWGLVGMTLVPDASDHPAFLFVHVTNITQRVRAETRLQQSEAHFRNLFEDSPIPVWEVDLSAAAGMLERWRGEGVTDLADFVERSPDQLALAVAAVTIRRINQAAAATLGVGDAAEMVRAVAAGRLGDGYRDAIEHHLDAVWHGRTGHDAAVHLLDASGAELYGIMHLVIPTVDGRPDLTTSLVSFTDLTEHRRAQDSLRRVEQRLRTVMAGAPIVVFAVDQNGIFTLSEGQGLSQLGLAPGEALGRSVFEMYRESPSVIRSMRRALAGEAFTSTAEVTGLILEIRYSPIWENGRVTGVIGVAYDVTQRERVTDQLRQLVRSKDEFVATVSHELRTPLTAVVGFAHELRDGLDELDAEEVRSFVDLIGEQAVEVGDLVEDLLVASRIDLNEVAVARDAIVLWDQVDAVMAARRIGKRIDTMRYLPDAKVFADPIRVRQIFRNLVTNADRYGGPNLTVRVDRLGDEFALSLIDDGAGIPEGDRSQVFEPYYRAHEAVSGAGAMGLGLTVSRQLARLMGGDLTYDYRQGHSIFTLTLPAV
jgi:PAS domain S-box-containing protein